MKFKLKFGLTEPIIGFTAIVSISFAFCISYSSNNEFRSKPLIRSISKRARLPLHLQ